MLRTEVTRHLASGWPLFNHFFLKTEFFVNGHVTRQRVSESVVLFPLRPEPSTGRRLTRPSCPLAGWLLSSPNPPRLRWPLVALRAPAPRLCFTRPPTPLPLPPTARWLRGGFLNVSSPGTHFPLSRGAGPPRVSSHGRERGGAGRAATPRGPRPRSGSGGGGRNDVAAPNAAGLRGQKRRQRPVPRHAHFTATYRKRAAGRAGASPAGPHATGGHAGTPF